MSDVSEVKSGFAFKKAVSDEATGDTSVIQIKDVTPCRPIPWDHLASVEGSPLMSGNALKRDMVIFSAKGVKNFAWHVDRSPHKTICTSLFHIIIPDVSRVDPAFLAWQINQFPAQTYLTQASAGVTVRNIRITAFKELPIVLPPMDIQKKTAHYAQSAYREKQLLLDLITNKETEMRALAANILTGHS
ncbi:restriction endonuclease subunit S [Paremcibacter congregatus]|uniref:restriction endonuclease subunit S n=1 Tax=Paremcibacter congregatus TaxID=2043170 RepID=UPI0030EE6CE7